MSRDLAADESSATASAVVDDRSVKIYIIPWGALGSPPLWLLYIVLFVLTGSYLAHLPIATLALVFPLGALVFFSFGSLKLSVGEDGLLVAGIFFPYDRVELSLGTGDKRDKRETKESKRQRRSRGAIVSILRTESHFHVYIPSGRSWRLSLDEPTVRELATQIELRVERFRRQPEPPEMPADLQVSAQADAKTQIHALRETFSPLSYRAGSVTTDALWNVAENPRTAPRLRIAATAALAAQATDADHVRLRVLTSSTVDDTLRERLELAADPKREDELFASLDSERDLANAAHASPLAQGADRLAK